MKTILTLLFIFAFGLSYSQECDSKMNQSERESYALKICGHSYNAWTDDDFVGDFERILLREIGVETNDPNRFVLIAEYLNKNWSCLVCGDDTVNKIREREQLFKRSIARGEYMYLQYLAYNDKYPINFNIYEIIDGEKETIIDYIEMILNDEELSVDYDVDELNSLIRALKERGAKRGKDL